MLIYRWFKCPYCGSVIMMSKQKKKRSEKNDHIKDIYCGVCQRVTKQKIIDWKRVK